MGDYKYITKVLVWIVVLSTVAYFVFLPVSFTRPNPQRVSPEKTIQANPLGVLESNIYPSEEKAQNSTSSTSTLFEIPKPLMELSE